MSEPLVWIGSLGPGDGAERVIAAFDLVCTYDDPAAELVMAGPAPDRTHLARFGPVPRRAEAPRPEVPSRSLARRARCAARPGPGLARLTMRILYVVPRYGPQAAGGAEGACRSFATRMAARGHAVEVVTSRAVSYQDWANVLDGGAAVEDGVLVHRLSAVEPRDLERFSAVSMRALTGRHLAPSHVQHAWLQEQGPRLEGLDDWLRDRARRIRRRGRAAVPVPARVHRHHDARGWCSDRVPSVRTR